jgi:DNA primase
VIQQWALNWSVEQLGTPMKASASASRYFHERGFSDDTIRLPAGLRARAGQCVRHRGARPTASTPELLEKAGWIKRREDGTAWDFFAGRVTFPVIGLSGQPIAFGARTLKSDKKLPKYFNSPESVLYVKSRSLYGIHHAKKAIVEQHLCCLVEGYTDVISLHQAGITNVVASSGTSLTEDQVRLIKRYAQHRHHPVRRRCGGHEGQLARHRPHPEGRPQREGGHLPRGRGSGQLREEPQQQRGDGEHLTGNAQDFLVFKAGLLMQDVGATR